MAKPRAEFEYHDIRKPEPLTWDELCALGTRGWCLFNIERAESPESEFCYHFRRHSDYGPDSQFQALANYQPPRPVGRPRLDLVQ